jgi:hypothetical protein
MVLAGHDIGHVATRAPHRHGRARLRAGRRVVDIALWRDSDEPHVRRELAEIGVGQLGISLRIGDERGAHADVGR